MMNEHQVRRLKKQSNNMKAAKKFKDVAFAEKMAEICFATSEW